MATVASTVAPIASDDPLVATARRDLAAAFRLASHYGWDDQIATHFSARLPDGTFLLNAFGLLFGEITASSLMRVDMDGNVLEPPGHPMNPAAFTVHSAVLAGRPDVACVMHLHTPDGTAVSALVDGLMPLNQSAMIIRGDIAYHDFEGIADDLDERTRLQRDIGTKNLLILRNHGTLTVGATVGQAFYRMFFLEWACRTQVRTLAMGQHVTIPAQAVQDHVTAQAPRVFSPEVADAFYWPAMLRMASRVCPGFDD